MFGPGFSGGVNTLAGKKFLGAQSPKTVLGVLVCGIKKPLKIFLGREIIRFFWKIPPGRALFPGPWPQTPLSFPQKPISFPPNPLVENPLGPPDIKRVSPTLTHVLKIFGKKLGVPTLPKKSFLFLGF